MFMKEKKGGIHPLQFILFWVAGYFGASLLGDWIWHISIDVIDDIVDSDGFFGIVLILTIGSTFFFTFYWMQKHWIQRLFHIDLRHWIKASLGGWFLGFLGMYVLIEWFEVAASDSSDENLRLVAVIVFSTVMLQWWLLRPMIQKAWVWVAAHLVFLAFSAFMAEEQFVYVVLLYSSPDYGFNDDFMTMKLLVVSYGIITGLTLLLLRRGELRKSKAKVLIT